MVEMTSEIEIGDLPLFDKVSAVSIEKSWKFLTSTARITLPRKLFPEGDLKNWKNANGEQLIKVGSPVTIKLGYDFDFQTEFVGFISKINAETPLVLECQDSMFLLKQTQINKSYPSATSLTKVLKDILPTNIKLIVSGEIELGKLNIDSVSVFDVLNGLNESYGLFFYFRNSVLYAGFAYENTTFKKATLDLKYNVASVDRLVYRNADDVKIQVRAISFQKNGNKIEKTIGDKDGELHTLHVPIGLTETQIEQYAKEKMKLFRFDGYEGEIKTFGQPFLEHRDVAKLVDDEYPEREGSYRIDTIKVDFDTSAGYKRTLSLGKLAT